MCEDCGSAYKRSGDLHKHRIRHLENKNGMSFADKAINQKKVEIAFRDNRIAFTKGHNGDKGPFNCDFCTKTLQSAQALLLHRTIHLGHKCKHCDIFFRNQIEFDDHLQRGECGTSVTAQILSNLKEAPKEVECNICGRTFQRNNHLQSHMITHMPAKAFLCECGMGFKLKGHLEFHQRKHVRELSKNNTLTKTDSDTTTISFAFPSNLDPSMAKELHFENNFNGNNTVNYIPGSASTFSSLHHPISPKGPEPHKVKCKTCGLAVKSEAHLANHMVTHSDIRPFICKACGKACKIIAALRKHEIYIHTDRSTWNAITLTSAISPLLKTKINETSKTIITNNDKSNTNYNKKFENLDFSTIEIDPSLKIAPSNDVKHNLNKYTIEKNMDNNNSISSTDSFPVSD